MNLEENEDARFGFLLDDEYTRKLLDVCEYKGTHPHTLILDSIDRLWEYLQEVKKNGR